MIAPGTNTNARTADIERLAADLDRAGFTVDAVTSLWGPAAAAALGRGRVEPALRALQAQHPSAPALVTLARLFVLNAPVPSDELDTALPTLGREGAERLGLVGGVAGTGAGAAPNGDADLVHPAADLRPYSFVDAHGVGAWWVVSDLGEIARDGALDEDHVLGIGGASTTLSGLMMSRPVASALDLGTGCGIQALHASRHAVRVVATDISERALRIADLNTRLNGVRTVELRTGSLYAPVAGERFDHIVSNPPFVITPRAADVPSYEYRDGGMIGDDLVREVVRGAADHLTEGGVAQILGNWEYSGTGDAFDRLSEWLDGTGLDAWIIERDVQDAPLYAETWIRDGGTKPGTPEFARLYTAWLDDFEQRGVTSVGFGYITLRRPWADAAPTIRVFERLAGGLGHNPSGLGDHIAECLAARDWLAARDDDALSHERVTVAPDVTEERHYWPGEEDPTVLTLHQGAGFGRSLRVDTALAAVVGACDGELTIGAILGAVASILDVDADALRDEVLPQLRDLIATAMLLPERLDMSGDSAG
ncbi:DUF7059 domain-containing protein [Planctomonas psychrotolerans]|uniref:DUF7059 domain-containing protein n=1 Tax=Planctomonas psychrotolerans TaxID=2528712 RepID=UPI001D0D73D7|nr:methyltransferase [Planctomonas psychrotolerans]